MLTTRLLTAFVAGPLVVALVIFGPPWGFPAFVVAIGAVGLHEFHRLAWPPSPPHAADAPGRHVATAIATGWTALAAGVPGDFAVAGLAAAAIALLTFHLARPEPIPSLNARMAASLSGLLYGGVPLAHLCWLHSRADGTGWRWICLLFVVVWIGDTAAYFGGRALGRHKLHPVASPNKTVEGAVAGLAGSVAAALLARAWFHPGLSPGDCVALGLAGGVVGQIGDLVESLWKRSAGVKDSGAFFPGHGGVLDRVDALLFAAPLFHWYAVWVAG